MLKMSRRSSSLVTISLDDVSTGREIESPDSTTPVIILMDDAEIDGFSSTERMIEIAVDICPSEPSLNQADVDSVGTCNKIKNWFQNFKIQCNCSCCLKQLSDFLRMKLEQLREKLNAKCSKSYLEMYFLYANVCGVSPFRFDKDNKQVVFLKKVPYYIVNTLAALDTVRITRQFILSMIGAHENKSMSIQVYLLNCLRGANILLRVGFFVSLKFHPEKYFKAVQTIGGSTYSKFLYTVKTCIESVLLYGSSLCVTLTITHIGLIFDGIQSFITENAEDAVSLLCLKRSCHYDDLQTLNSATMSLGVFGWAVKLAGNLFEQIARDGILYSALTLGQSARAFRFKKRVKNSNPEEAVNIGAEINADYKGIKKISKHINSAFNIVFRFYLLANIFMFAVFIDEWFNPKMEKSLKVAKLANIVCVCITFYYANQTAKTGDRFREWMKKEKNRNILGMSEMNVMTENSSSSSIGFGRGALFIYDSTLIGFASVVAAYFFGLVETRPQNNMGKELGDICPCTNSSEIPYTLLKFDGIDYRCVTF